MHLNADEVTAVAGTWLLFAGSLRQAALELQEQDVDREGLSGAKESVPTPATPSWWWLLPPVAVVRHLRIRQRYRRTVLAALTPAQARQWRRFAAKCMAWLAVALGGLLLASREMHALARSAGWPVWAFWLSTASTLFACSASVVGAQRRTQRLARGLRDPDQPRPPRAAEELR